MNWKTWQAIIVGLVIGFLGGVGAMQASIVKVQAEQHVRLGNLESRQLEAERVYEKRIENIVRLWEKSIEQQSKLISLVEQIIITQQAKKG